MTFHEIINSVFQKCKSLKYFIFNSSAGAMIKILHYNLYAISTFNLSRSYSYVIQCKVYLFYFYTHFLNTEI